VQNSGPMLLLEDFNVYAMEKSLIKILLVEDDAADVRLVERILAKSSELVKFAVELVGSLSAAINCLSSRNYDIMLLDLGLPDSSGIKTVQKVCEATDIPVVVLTGIGNEKMGLSAIRNGASDYLIKDLPLNILLVRTIIYTLERRKTIEALARSESKFRTLVENIPKKIFIKDKNSVYLFSNHNYAQDLKIQPEEIVGKTDYDFYAKELAEKYCADDKRIIKTGKTEDIEEKYIENGEERWVHTVKTPYKDAKGNIIGVLGIFRDITEQKNTEELILETNRQLQEATQKLVIAKQELENKNQALEKAREELEKQVEQRTEELTKANKTLQAVEENMHKMIIQNVDGLIVVNRNGIARFVNPAACSLFNRKPEEFIGEIFGFPVVAGRSTEIDVIHRDGKPVTAEMQVVEIDWEGESVNLVSIRDITDHKLAMEKVKYAAQQWRTTFDSISDMVSIHDRNFKIIRVNKALADFFEIEPKELIGKTCYELFHGTKQPCQNCPLIQTLNLKKPANLEIFEQHLGVHLGIFTSPVLDKEGEVVSSVHIAKNITERKQAEEALKEANEKLIEYNQLKDEFVSTASHELRTPLSIIMGAIRLILDEIPGKIVDEQRDILATAMENVKRLARIVDSLLTISKIESGKVDLHKTAVNICELIKDTVSYYKLLAEEKELSLDYEVPEEGIDICLDPDRTKEILINLISNSIKFTPERGWVKVTCAERNGEVLVSVQDSGVGIAKEDIPKLFDKFTQFGRKVGPGEKGTGLGLAITKNLVDMHNGRIEVESKVDQGTTFTISLPLTVSEKDDLPAEADELVENTLTNN